MAMPLLASLDAPAAVLTKFKFDENSVLADGKWVRITVPETGIYEITYDELREMGFSDPSAVGVYGRGGAMLDFNFTSSGGSKVFQDNPSQIPVLHANGKLIFYGQGTATIKPSSVNSGANMKFTRDSRNIYTDVASYLLSDKNPALEITTKTVTADGATERDAAFGYIYHENDITQGGSGTGQIFYGEPLASGSPLSFTLSHPYSRSSASYAQARFAVALSYSGSLNISLNGKSKSFSCYSSSAAGMLDFSMSDGGAFNTDGSGKLDFDISGFTANLLALDWWTVTCPIDLKLMAADKSFDQQYFVFYSSKNSKWKFKLPAGSLAWYVGSGTLPESLDVQNDGYAYGLSSTALDEVVVFNPESQLKQIASWQAVENQNLHALINEPVELLIYTTEDMAPYAHRIADLHKKYDGIYAAVVTPGQLYNEFNAGTPDPLAYRALAKMLFQRNYKPLKNVLFLGRMSGDVRNVRGIANFTEPLIAYQENLANPATSAINIMDYYAVMTDYLTYPNNLGTAPMSIGVGLLPISTHEEGSIAVAKIEEYLSTEDFSNIVNETMITSCNGDEYLHDAQAANYTNMMQSILSSEYGSRFSHNHVTFQNLQQSGVQQNFKAGFERGKAYSMYFGHGIDYNIGTKTRYLTINDIMSLDNKELAFQFMAACSLCFPDQGHQGMGDVGVTRSPRGFIGAIVGTRSVMSNENESLARTFFNKLYYDENNNLRKTPATVGEAYAIAKDMETSPSQLAFMLFGDPAIRLPLALGKVAVEVNTDNVFPNDLIQVTGRVLNENGQTNTSYNGYATVKLMKPAVSVPVPGEIDTMTGLQLASDMTDLRLATLKAKVTNGVFTVAVPVPASATEFMSTGDTKTTLPVYAATYNPTTKIGCSGIGEVPMAFEGTERDEDAPTDNVKPEVRWVYDNVMRTITLTATDNVALLPGIGNGRGIYFAIDGEIYDVPSSDSYGVASSSYTGTVSTAHLKPGTYTGRLYAVDLAGNQSDSQRVTIEVKDAEGLVLTADADFAIEEMPFTLKGDTSEVLTLIMTDMDGRTVFSDEVTGNTLSCDVSDLKPGLYRAAVRHNSPKGSQLYSNWVEFTVID